MPRPRLLLAWALLSLWACSYDRLERAGSCRQSTDCTAEQECYRGFCVAVQGANPTGMPCEPGEPAQTCFEGDPATLDVGACVAGSRSCVDGVYTACLNQVLAQREVCNGLDDDCNGSEDDIAQESCATGFPGACAQGELVCQGAFAVCQPATLPKTEECNGIDDDCDGEADDVSPVACYGGKVGCVIGPAGRPTCTGLCRAGVTQCQGGVARCVGDVTPRVERCTAAGETAADEDCDGTSDEACSCRDGDTLPCYSGPQDTAGQGVCHAGTQTCAGRAWGACDGEVTPAAETCGNPGADDDCNGVMDDVAGVGETCFEPANQGICRDGVLGCMAGELHCATPEPLAERCDAIDQDCDGQGYNGFDLTSSATCGTACESCGKKETCCAGRCVATLSFATDDANCGACGKRCGTSQFCCQGKCTSYASKTLVDEAVCACSDDCGSKYCCGRQCLDFDNDEQNCGGCGVVCARNTSCCNGVCRSLCILSLGIEIAP